MHTLLQSPVFAERGVRHGFSSRRGGVSQAPFDSMNLARNVGDAAAAVAENHRLFALAVGFQPDRLFEVNQVHGGVVHVASERDDPEMVRCLDADAVITALPGAAVGVRVADCVAVLLHSADGRVVGAAHSGWRGTVANIVGRTVAALTAHAHCHADDVYALICPHIGVAAFEVGSEVVQALSRVLPGVHGLVEDGARRPHVHLGRAVEAQLVNAGVPRAQISQLTGCTYTDAAQFFSYRRDGARSGRHLAAIVAGC